MTEETSIREWVAALPRSSGPSFIGRLSKTGGTLRLDDHAVRFKRLVGLGRPRELSLRDIESVADCGRRPARLELVTRGGAQLVLIVVPTRTTSIRSGSAVGDGTMATALVHRRLAELAETVV